MIASLQFLGMAYNNGGPRDHKLPILDKSERKQRIWHWSNHKGKQLNCENKVTDHNPNKNKSAKYCGANLLNNFQDMERCAGDVGS